jgi:hypothetical protein
MRTKPGVCARKRRYATAGEAERVALAAQATLRVYRCELCRKWHLTSRTKGMRIPAPLRHSRVPLRHPRESGDPG